MQSSASSARSSSTAGSESLPLVRRIAGSSSDQLLQPTSGSNGRRCSHAKHTSEMVPARPPMTMHASPARANEKVPCVSHPAGNDNGGRPVGLRHVVGRNDANYEPAGSYRVFSGDSCGRTSALADDGDSQLASRAPA